MKSYSETTRTPVFISTELLRNRDSFKSTWYRYALEWLVSDFVVRLTDRCNKIRTRKTPIVLKKFLLNKISICQKDKISLNAWWTFLISFRQRHFADPIRAPSTFYQSTCPIPGTINIYQRAIEILIAGDWRLMNADSISVHLNLIKFHLKRNFGQINLLILQ